jgi:hypothetical protein
VIHFKPNSALIKLFENTIPESDKEIVLQDSVVKFKYKKSRDGHVKELSLAYLKSEQGSDLLYIFDFMVIN